MRFRFNTWLQLDDTYGGSEVLQNDLTFHAASYEAEQADSGFLGG
jgi:hypothetical protein